MYLLKCDHCGHYNSLKTEFLTFCTSCGKKITNNFHDYHKEHPDVSFSDFQQRFGVADNGPQAVVFKPRRSMVPVIVGVLAGVVMLSLLGIKLYFFTGGKIESILLKQETSEAILESEWERYDYGSLGLSLTTPVKMSSAELPFPDEYKHILRRNENFYYRPSKSVQVIASSVLYNEDITVSLQGAATGAISYMTQQPGMSDVQNTFSNVIQDGMPAIIAEGSFRENGILKNFKCIIVAERTKMWQVLTAYQPEDENGRKITERIFESLQINKDIKIL